MAGGAIVGGALAGVQLLQAKQQADAYKRQSQFEAQSMEFNAQLTDLQNLDRGEKAVEDVHYRERQVKQMLGAQKVAMAAQGIEVEGELGEQFERDEREAALEDIQNIKNNAWREALGLEIRASDLRTQAKFTKFSGGEKARSTLVTGGLSAIGTGLGAYDRYKRNQIRPGNK